MKKLLLIGVFLTIGFIGNAQTYVDLGLSSGTRWSNKNESGYWAYSEAHSSFHFSLPSEEQFAELIAECNWTWTGSGYRITGPNGNSIYLPAEGVNDDKGSRECHTPPTKDTGYYWSSESFETDRETGYQYTTGLYFDERGYRCKQLTVRLDWDRTCSYITLKGSVRLVQ